MVQQGWQPNLIHLYPVAIELIVLLIDFNPRFAVCAPIPDKIPANPTGLPCINAGKTYIHLVHSPAKSVYQSGYLFAISRQWFCITASMTFAAMRAQRWPFSIARPTWADHLPPGGSSGEGACRR